jgi:hypothetical protein
MRNTTLSDTSLKRRQHPIRLAQTITVTNQSSHQTRQIASTSINLPTFRSKRLPFQRPAHWNSSSGKHQQHRHATINFQETHEKCASPTSPSTPAAAAPATPSSNPATKPCTAIAVARPKRTSRTTKTTMTRLSAFVRSVPRR